MPEPSVLSPPSATDGVVAVIGHRSDDIDDGRVVAFDHESGERLWSHDFGRATGLLADGGSVYAGERLGSGRGRIYAFDAADGNQRWTQTVGNIGSSMAIAGDTLYTANGTLAALSTDDGAVRWEQSEVDGVGFTVAVAPQDQLFADERAVYYGDDEGVFAMSPGDGSLRWAWRPDRWDWADVGPVPAGDSVYAGSAGDIAMLDADDGSLRWRTSFGDDAQVVGVHERGSTVLVAEGTDESPSDTFGTLYELAVRDGSERYEVRFDSPVERTASTDEAFVVGTRAGRIRWSRGASFFEPFETTLSADGYLLGAAGTQAFAQTGEGTLWALSPDR
ncbi:outer membrane protein assembly factor BamB family protein [Haloferax denitrificans]|uniref:outer membrane protein assembly factor BamB family protein n=1 Tax=Haloferax denitrificans TaxID=35745 RepID=UPI000677C51E